MNRWSLLLVMLATMVLTCGDVVVAEMVLRLRPLAAATRHLEEGRIDEPRGIDYDRRAGEIWVADSRTQLLAAFNAEGTPLYATRGGGVFREPYRLAVDPRGDLWVLDSDRTRIAHLDWRGAPKPTPTLEGLPEEPALTAIAIDENGNLYVGEAKEGRIHVFDRELRPWFQFGSRGTDDGQFSAIVDIAVIGDWIAVVDTVARPVQLFNRRGEFVRGWGEHAIGAHNFSLPQGITIDSKERVIVVDALRQEIKFFDISGRFLSRFGGLGSRPGQVSFPFDVAVDDSDRLYVAEVGNGRVQVFAIEEMDVPTPQPKQTRRRRSSGRR